MKCDGECSNFEGDDGCKGEVKKVLVSGHGFKEPFKFNYCQAAIAEDLRRGFSVDVIDEHGLTEAEARGETYGSGIIRACLAGFVVWVLVWFAFC